MLALATPASAQLIDFDPRITAEEFGRFSRVVAQGIYATPVQPAGSSGLLRFDVGIAVTAIDIDTTEPYWQLAVGDDFDYQYGDFVGVPRLVVMKGLGVATVSGSYAKIADSDITILGGALDIPIIDGGLIRPTLASRGSYSTLRGVDDYEHNVYGLEAFLGKGFGPITPYAAYGRMRSDATAIISPGGIVNPFTLEHEADIDRITLGARLSLGILKLVVEGTDAEVRSYSGKLSIGF